MSLHCFSDSKSAKLLSEKPGPGKIKHMHLRFLFIQEMVRSRQVHIWKVTGLHNMADIFTKHVTRQTLDHLLTRMGVVRRIRATLQAVQKTSASSCSSM